MMMVLQKLRLIESNDHAALHPNGPDITWVSVNNVFTLFL